MTAWTFLTIYLGGSALIALRMVWHIRTRMDEYDRMFSNVRSTFWLDVILWPLLLLFSPNSVIHPKFLSDVGESLADTERELDRLAQNPPPCGASIRYVPTHDEAGECDSEFVFDAAAVEAIMAKRLAELPVGQDDRHAAILNWVRQRDPSLAEPTDIPALWSGQFLKIAVEMMDQGHGQVRCGQCRKVIPQEQISIDTWSSNKVRPLWVYGGWRCPQKHVLLTKDATHFFYG
jgi:hypothetical protein